MNLNTIVTLQNTEVDIEGALRRFGGNSALYERFLKKFLEDGTFLHVKTAFESNNEEEALTSAHTLKGVTANLGMTRLYEISSDMVSRIREGSYEAAAERLPDLENAYKQICDIISKD